MPERELNDEGKASLTDPDREDREDDIVSPTNLLLEPVRPGTLFRTQGRVVRDGSLIAATKQLIPMALAVELGLANEDGTPSANAEYYLQVPAPDPDLEMVWDAGEGDATPAPGAVAPKPRRARTRTSRTRRPKTSE